MQLKRISTYSLLCSLAILIGCKGTSHMEQHTTESGLRYTTLKQGSGSQPQKGQTVQVHYTGWLNDNDQPGKKFDSSLDRGQPIEFILGAGRVIQGWEEGISTMQLGEKRRLYIPANLAYGTQGAGNIIPPHAALIFDVELVHMQ
ncbi:MAG: FKBP-type peptidyl-prolyl cis-trans isomerase [Thermoplasmatota archaeon]